MIYFDNIIISIINNSFHFNNYSILTFFKSDKSDGKETKAGRVKRFFNF